MKNIKILFTILFISIYSFYQEDKKIPSPQEELVKLEAELIRVNEEKFLSTIICKSDF